MKDETYTLLIYELVPEETKLYLIPNKGEHGANVYRESLEIAAGHFINHDMNDEEMNACQIISSLLATKPEYCPGYEKYATLWIRYLTSTPITGVNITSVYLTGFIL